MADLIESLKNVQYFLIHIGSIAGLILAFKALHEYQRNNKYKRVEYYLKLRERFENVFFRHIESIESNDTNAINSLSNDDKLKIIGFCEDLALAVNTGLMSLEIASYMFGFYVLKCWKCDAFWVHSNVETFASI